MNSSLFKTLILKSLAFFVIWLILSGKFNLFHMGVGLASSVGLAWFHTGHRDFPPRFLPFARICWYIPWLLGRIFRSGLHLSILILHPALPIAPKLISYKTTLRDRAAIVLLGNSITLTPGTVTVEVNSQDFLVHTIDDESAHDLTSLQLENKIMGIFQETHGS
jgi:multicomponent Na+:H+ antiporter subunit E